MQALFRLMEKNVKVSGRPKDQEILKKAVDDAASEFRDKSGIDVRVEVDDQLSDKSWVALSSLLERELGD